MKHRILFTLPLAAALMVPAMAQQNAPAQQPSQPAAQSDQSAPATAPAQNQQDLTATQSNQASKDQSQLASGKQPLVYESRQGFWGKINPFARKKYVQRQLNPVRDRVNELDELTAANSKMIRDVDSRATEGIRMASAKASEADSHAVEAGNKAQMAQSTAQQANQNLQTVSNVVSNIDQYQPATQVEIVFRPGQSVLSKKAKDALDDLAGQLKDQKGYILEVQGFSSGRGIEAVRNSQNMADAVVRYMVLNHEIPVYRIYTLGMGNAPMPASSETGKVRRTRGGRVEVSLAKNGIADLNQQLAASGNQGASQTGGTTGAVSAPATQPATNQPATAQPAQNMNPPAQQQTPPASQQPPANPPQK